ncbi:MAG: type IV secretion system DNA-binding domain-containing protein, partial [Gemmatimonadaceae bacterium]|jgi:hypothetical protein|nr:type IV secretion system DNA-binding domain-containing protein [Gemmatimonadaceae bacterium]
MVLWTMCNGSRRHGAFPLRLIGDREILRPQTSYSRTDSILVSYQSSVTQGVRHVTEAAGLPSEIAQLPHLEGLVKFA